MSSEILIVDDEADIRNLIRGILEDEGYSVREAANSDQALEQVEVKPPALVVLDIWLQGSKLDGLEILKELKHKHPDLPFVMISGHGTIETAVSAIKDGAYDFIEKPFKSDRLLMMITRALETAALKRENLALRQRAQDVGPEDLTGSSAPIQAIRQAVERVAPTNSRVLIKGDAGTGKDVVARLLHKNSARANGAFLVVNCATLQPERLEAELFGAEEGGGGSQPGLLEKAHGGTLLLDEVADMPLQTQGKIVRALQEQQFHRIGGQELIKTDVRVIATTNRDMEEEIKNGNFREDLYYRLNVVEIAMPPLSKRPEDIAELAAAFLHSMLGPSGQDERQFSDAALKALKAHPWPGNVRQLKNVVEWVSIMHGNFEGERFGVEHLPPEFSGQNGQAPETAPAGMQDQYLELPLRDAREAFEREYLLAQVERFEGNISKTAQFVGMERSALHRKLKSLQINHDKNQADAESEPAVSRKRA